MDPCCFYLAAPLLLASCLMVQVAAQVPAIVSVFQLVGCGLLPSHLHSISRSGRESGEGFLPFSGDFCFHSSGQTESHSNSYLQGSLGNVIRETHCEWGTDIPSCF